LSFKVTKNSSTMSDANFLDFKNIILNLAVGGDFDGDPDGTTSFPQFMDVDYMRVWQNQTGLLGDYNHDQVVNAADYTVWQDSLGQSGIGLAADGSGNGTIDMADYTIWQTKFGMTDGGAGAGASAAAVPEPTFIFVATLGIAALAWRRLSRRQTATFSCREESCLVRTFGHCSSPPSLPSTQ
jgi:hypothetical protein